MQHLPTMDCAQFEWSSFVERWLDTIDCHRNFDTNNDKENDNAISGFRGKERHRHQSVPTTHTQSQTQTPAARLAQQRCLAMATPPPSSSSYRQPSPGKKRKLAHRGRRTAGGGGLSRTNDDSDVFQQPDEDVDDEAADRTPRSNARFNAFTNGPALPPHTPSQSSASVASSSKRSMSPVKSMRELDALDKPIRSETMQDDATGQLNEDVRALYARLYEIMVENDAFLPLEARDQIRAAAGRHYKDSWFRAPEARRDHNTATEALAELAALLRVVSAAKECLGLGRSEAAWNTLVHDRILEVALAHSKNVRRELITTAQIAMPFVPCMNGHAKTDLVERKMVDFAMVLSLDDRLQLEQPGSNLLHTIPSDPDSIPHSNADSEAEDEAALDRLARSIQQHVWSSTAQCSSVNQTLYPPLQYSPIAVAIETKVVRPAQEGRVQLAVWAAAWHERMHKFLTQDSVSRRDGAAYRPIVSLPLILVTEHDWKLSFACDGGDQIRIVGDMAIGGTKTITDVYKLVACLRELADWVQGPFRSWLTPVFIRNE